MHGPPQGSGAPERVRLCAALGGWPAHQAAAHFDRYAERYQVGEAVEFTCGEADRLRRLDPRVQVAPILYRVEDDRLVQVYGPDGGPR